MITRMTERMRPETSQRLHARALPSLNLKKKRDYLQSKGIFLFQNILIIVNNINQLPRLSGRWVPGIPRGFHCGQPAPR